MSRPIAAIALAAALTVLSPALAAAQSARITVPLDQAHRVSVRGQAGSVIVGNPMIADVTVVDANTLYITGKGYGTTEVVVVDAVGRVLFNSQVQVTDSDAGRVRVWRGAQASEMSCANSCVASTRGGMSGAPASAAPMGPGAQ